jgi:hypothetical protein
MYKLSERAYSRVFGIRKRRDETGEVLGGGGCGWAQQGIPITKALTMTTTMNTGPILGSVGKRCKMEKDDGH